MFERIILCTKCDEYVPYFIDNYNSQKTGEIFKSLHAFHPTVVISVNEVTMSRYKNVQAIIVERMRRKRGYL